MIPSITCLHSSIVYFTVLSFEMLTSVHGALKEVYVPDKTPGCEVDQVVCHDILMTQDIYPDEALNAYQRGQVG